MIRKLALIALGTALAACGSKATLQPPAGQQLPVAAYGQDHRPSADELLEPPVQAAPERSVELRRRSEEREDDPFDIPPEG
jgi:predicted small lipoprotein YifL